MTLNTFIAAVCVVVAIMLTIAHIRFFFGEETHKQQGELFHQPPHDEAAPVSAGDTLRTRRRDNAADLRILRKQIIVGAALTLVVVIPILIHTFAPHCPLGPSWPHGGRRCSSRRSCSTAATRCMWTAGRHWRTVART